MSSIQDSKVIISNQVLEIPCLDHVGSTVCGLAFQ